MGFFQYQKRLGGNAISYAISRQWRGSGRFLILLCHGPVDADQDLVGEKKERDFAVKRLERQYRSYSAPAQMHDHPTNETFVSSGRHRYDSENFVSDLRDVTIGMSLSSCHTSSYIQTTTCSRQVEKLMDYPRPLSSEDVNNI
jgi:hypothetical protein